MTILVDQAIWPWRGKQWAHLVSDESYDELHEFAGRLGIPRRGFQGDHYDIPADYRVRALEFGAESVDARVLVRRLKAAGLRRSRATGLPTPESALVRQSCGEGFVGRMTAGLDGFVDAVELEHADFIDGRRDQDIGEATILF